MSDEKARDPVGAAHPSPTRLRAFAEFFKGYMSVSSIVVAAMPIPVTALGLIPTYDAHTKILSVLTPLFCFLTLGYVFYLRHSLARVMFPSLIHPGPLSPNVERKAALVRSLPLVLVILTVLLSGLYLFLFFRSKFYYGQGDIFTPLETFTIDFILPVCYLGIFLAAEGAFVIMAIQEYLQDLLGFSERDLIYGTVSTPQGVTPSVSPSSPPAAHSGGTTGHTTDATGSEPIRATAPRVTTAPPEARESGS